MLFLYSMYDLFSIENFQVHNVLGSSYNHKVGIQLLYRGVSSNHTGFSYYVTR